MRHFLAIIGHATNLLWIIGIALLTISSISLLWGWHVVSLTSLVALLVFVWDCRKRFIEVLKNNSPSLIGERRYVLFVLISAFFAVLINLIIGGAALYGVSPEQLLQTLVHSR